MDLLFRAVERWAANDPDRERVLIAIILAALAMVVIGGIFVVAELVLPPQWRPI